MQFHQKLDCLMNLTNISNSELSKKTNIDPSLISRWRRGIKTPDIFSDTIKKTADILAQRINSDLRRNELAEHAGCPITDLSDSMQITEVILTWFHKDMPKSRLGQSGLSATRPYPSYEQREASQLDLYSRPEAHCFGSEGRKQALSWILSYVEYWHRGNGTLRFFTDQPFEYLDIDCTYYENQFRETPYAEKFRIVKILQPITATEQERLRALQFANLFMNTAIVSIAFIEQKEVSVFQHSLGIYDNQMAICSYGFYGSRYTSSYIHRDEAFVHELTNDFDIHFDSAQIALQPNNRFTFQDMYHTLSDFYSRQDSLYYTGTQILLPFIPPELISTYMQKFDTLSDVKHMAYREQEAFCTFLKSYHVFATFPLISPEEWQHEKGTPMPCIFVERNCKITLSPEQYLKILQHLLQIYSSNDNLELSFCTMDPDLDLWSNSDKLLYSKQGECFVPYQSNHPAFIRPLHEIQVNFFQEHLKRAGREETKERLQEVICRFRGLTNK